MNELHILFNTPVLQTIVSERDFYLWWIDTQGDPMFFTIDGVFLKHSYEAQGIKRDRIRNHLIKKII